MENIIGFLKKIRKQNSLKNQYTGKYAFVGIGNHSKNNLYPVLNYLNLNLKYIVTKSPSTTELINKNYPSVTATNNFEKVLNDEEIKGIFISANPDSHYELVKKSLEHRKNVFVEKPPCTTIEQLNDLIDIEKTSGAKCLVGLQKRYSVSTLILKKEISDEEIISYNYRFILGSYPEGDPILDLFIHPVDLTSFLFGDTELHSITKTENTKGKLSVFLHTKHRKNIIGSLEMSTDYTWDMPTELLTVNTRKGIYTMENHQVLTFQPKAGTFLSMPKEKIFPSVPEKKYLFNGNNFLPVVENNQIVSQGYFNEIKTFADICENKKAQNNSPLNSLVNTFELISQIKK
ncbi:MAG: Gfo/Idh/MocA family oxidoreductase [Bacteroidales bacterium]|jgi:virulence factor|nr:Gfo/Idh/MocA family oxidoreductase [Bacteroidales bacterium]